MYTYLKTTRITKGRIFQERRELTAGLDRPMILGLKGWPKSFRKKRIVIDRNFIVESFFAVDETLDSVTTIVQNKSRPGQHPKVNRKR